MCMLTKNHFSQQHIQVLQPRTKRTHPGTALLHVCVCHKLCFSCSNPHIHVGSPALLRVHTLTAELLKVRPMCMLTTTTHMYRFSSQESAIYPQYCTLTGMMSVYDHKVCFSCIYPHIGSPAKANLAESSCCLQQSTNAGDSSGPSGTQHNTSTGNTSFFVGLACSKH